MRNNNVHTMKSVISKLLVTLMVLLSVVMITPEVADAASKPALTKTSQTVLAGKKYDINVKSKVAKSTYVWSSSNKKIATVDNKGVVQGVSAGTATITCKITTPKKNTYSLKCVVTIRKGASAFTIKNKVTALNVGQTYDLDRKLTPSTSNDKTTWTSTDKTIAAPDKNGKFIALKVGTVTITGTTLSGKSDSVTIKVVDKDGTVTNQSDLNSLLGSGAQKISIVTGGAIDLTIAAGDYSKQSLVVDAPKADISNFGKFASIEIKQIASDTWQENAVGNLLKVLAKDARIVVGSNAQVSIEVNEAGATLKIENNGKVEKLFVSKEAAIAISGTSKESIPVEVKVPNIKITTSVPLNLACEAKMELTLLAGAEATKVQAATESVVPTVKGSVDIKVTVGTGTTAKEVTVVATPVTTTTGNSGNSGNSGSNDTTTPIITKSVSGGAVTFTLSKSYTELKKVVVAYHGSSYIVDGDLLTAFLKYMGDKDAQTKWFNTTNTSKEYSNGIIKVTVTVKSNAAGNTKTVTISGINKSYEVTVNPNTSSVTVKNIASGKTFTVTKVGDKELKINTDDNTLDITPSF